MDLLPVARLTTVDGMVSNWACKLTAAKQQPMCSWPSFARGNAGRSPITSPVIGGLPPGHLSPWQLARGTA